MTERAGVIAAFLQKTPYAHWDQQPIAGDASARRYWRLNREGQSVILMDDPPQTGGSTSRFAAIARHLKDHGLTVPEVLAHDASAGLMLLGDLGAEDFVATLSRQPAQESLLYRAAADVLIHLRNIPAPDGLSQLTPEVGAEMVGILSPHYTTSNVNDLMAEVASALTTHAPHPTTLALRDYHAENLIWRAGEEGNARVGLLDFQDAFIAPEGYDLASLLRDARRNLPAAIVKKMIAHYMRQTDMPATFPTQLAVLGVQRNLRILGVFARLAQVQGKTRYLTFMPRVWDNILLDLADPALSTLREAVRDCVPAPTPDHIKGIAS